MRRKNKTFSSVIKVVVGAVVMVLAGFGLGTGLYMFVPYSLSKVLITSITIGATLLSGGLITGAIVSNVKINKIEKEQKQISKYKTQNNFNEKESNYQNHYQNTLKQKSQVIKKSKNETYNHNNDDEFYM